MQQLDVNEKAIEVQLSSAQSKIDQAKTLVDLYQKQTAALEVKAGIGGEVAALPTPCRSAHTWPPEPRWQKSFSSTS